MQNAGLEEAQAGIKISRGRINNLDMQMTPPLCRKQRRTEEPLDENEKAGLKFKIQKKI